MLTTNTTNTTKTTNAGKEGGTQGFGSFREIVTQEPETVSGVNEAQDKVLNPKKSKQKVHLSTSQYLELVAEVILFVFFINAFLLQTYVIPSPSMENSMLIGDHLVVDKVGYSRSIGAFDGFIMPRATIRRGMIVTFSGPSEINNNLPPKNLVKRVIATPGQTIKLIGNRVYINGELIAEPYVEFKSGLGVPNFPASYWHHEFPEKYRKNIVNTAQGEAFLVPQGHYFCMGDNRNNSFDSRSWGPLPGDYIIGKPWRVYWSYSSSSDDYRATGFVDKVKDFLSTLTNIFTKTRWERTFKKY